MNRIEQKALPTVRRRRPAGRALVVVIAALVLVGFGAIGAIGYYRSEREQWLSKGSTSSLEEYVRRAPDDVEAKFRLAYRLNALSRVEEATRYMEEVVRREPGNSGYWYGLARSAGSAGNLVRAEEAFREAIRLRPRDPIAHYELAQMLATAGLPRHAVREFGLAAEKGDPNELARYHWARCLADLGDKAQAWNFAYRSVTSYPAQDDGYVLLGQLAVELRRRDEAEPLLRRRYQMMTAYEVGIARAPLARLLLYHPRSPEDRKEAVVQAGRAARDHQSRPYFHAVHAEVLLATGDPKGAEQAARRGLAMDPSDHDCLTQLALALRKLGKDADAARVAARIRRSPRDDPGFAALVQKAESDGTAASFHELVKRLREARRVADAAEYALLGHERTSDPALESLARECYRDALKAYKPRAPAPVRNVDLYDWSD